ncbi:MAG: hypothetical protein K2O79_08140, partial [Muribaculaceae bacterium]|nr:hypothetical protein [Muribaculaceae bacterium]
IHPSDVSQSLSISSFSRPVLKKHFLFFIYTISVFALNIISFFAGLYAGELLILSDNNKITA